ncbi:MAG: CopG family transcriptional regulator [Halobacteriales archaeon]
MGNKNKTVSFRVNEESFDRLRDIAEQRDLSLSALFRDYVDKLVAHDGQVEVVPARRLEDADEETFPPKVKVPKSFVREHERLELEAEHLREQLEEHKRYVTHLRERLEELDGDEEEVVNLEDLDADRDIGDVGEELDQPHRLG